MKPFKEILFGCEQSFSAICAYDVDYKSKDHLFGSIYCVCHGQTIGDTSTVVLPTVTSNLRSIMSSYDYRLASSFSELNQIGVFNHICSVIDEANNPDYDLQIKFEKIRIDIGSIIFDGFDICLISNDDIGTDILTWKGYDLNKIFSYTLKYGMVFNIFTELCDFVDSLQN